MKYLLPLVFILSFISCHHYPKAMRDALDLAGDNRLELEAVLEHYSQNPADSLKYLAACFLIENMPGHYSYKDTSLLKRYYSAMDSVINQTKELGVEETIKCLEEVSSQFHSGQLEVVPDIRFVSSGFLIDNIDRSFDLWETDEWATHLKFDDFCEYILPYKVAELQPLDNWKKYLENDCKGNIDTLHFCALYENSAYQSCLAVNRSLKEKLNPRIVPNGKLNIIPLLNPRSMLEMTVGRCDNYCIITTMVMRSKGIPVVIDETPQWPFRSMGHSWNVALNNTGKNVVFGGANTNPGEPHKEDHKLAKVFRKTFAVNRDIMSLIEEEKDVPNCFRDFFKKDVTSEYLKTEDIEIELDVKIKHKYAYLAVFDNKEWIPVQYGKISGRKVLFKEMGRDVVYLPVCYEENGIIPIANPFILTEKGEIIRLNTNTDNNTTLVINRKYPVFPRVYNVGKRVLGGKIQASEYPDFKNCVTLHTITCFGVQSQEIKIDEVDNQYRYWRYLSPDSAYCNMADLYFIAKNSESPIQGNIIGTEGSIINDGLHDRNVVFDNNPLTYFDAPTPNGSWVGMDFGSPVTMDKIWYVPRGDGNCVTPGHQYELFYWNDNRWVSAGKKRASDIKLTYGNIPPHTLYWLRDLTEGTEERIFTYKEGKQIWW